MRPSITQGTRLNSRSIKSLGAVLFVMCIVSSFAGHAAGLVWLDEKRETAVEPARGSRGKRVNARKRAPFFPLPLLLGPKQARVQARIISPEMFRQCIVELLPLLFSHRVSRLSVFCGDSVTRAQADGNAHFFLRFHPTHH
jgi:hypothetical protein